MKLRIKDNSLRLRLTQLEVKQFETKGQVEKVIKFGNNVESQMRYILQQSKHDQVTAAYQSNKMVVYVPKSIALNWTTSSQVGFSHRIVINGREDLLILVEKDFKCLKPREEEDEKDMFPNPEEGSLKC